MVNLLIARGRIFRARIAQKPVAYYNFVDRYSIARRGLYDAFYEQLYDQEVLSLSRMPDYTSHDMRHTVCVVAFPADPRAIKPSRGWSKREASDR